MVAAHNIIGGGKKENRAPRDFYATPVDVTHALMHFLAGEGLTPSKVWECACGNYAMSNVIKEYTGVVATDIFYGKEHDFMKASRPVGIDAIITNPPFNIADKFIYRSVFHGVPLIAMLLKSTYWHAAKRLKLFNDHRPAYILPLTWRPDFDGRGAPTMDMIWTVWIAGKTVTEFRPLNQAAAKQLTLWEVA